VKLFPRLLLGFLAANLLTVLAVLLLSTAWWALSYSAGDARRDGEQAAQILEREGPQALRLWLRQHRREAGVFAMLLDADGGSLLGGRRGPPLPPALRELPGSHGDGWMARLVGERVRSVTIRGAGAEAYRWVAVVPPPSPLQSPLLGAFIQILIGAFIIVAAAYWLARSISRPIRQLQRASGATSGGGAAPDFPPRLLSRRDELGDLARAQRAMTRRQGELLQTQRQLLRDVSHELRSPLARLRLASELARDTPKPVHFDRIARETERLDALIGRILLLQRLESPEHAASAQRISVAGIVAPLCEDVAFEAQAADVALHLPEWQEVARDGDPDWLRAAFENILRNALRYSPAGGTIVVTQQLTSTDEIVTIRDSGPGVEAALLECIFEPFVRVSAAREAESGGHGVGLAIARRAVARHGGSVTARNAEPHGLVVEVRLPR
jgi:signal transduction histidine kinase